MPTTECLECGESVSDCECEQSDESIRCVSTCRDQSECTCNASARRVDEDGFRVQS